MRDGRDPRDIARIAELEAQVAERDRIIEELMGKVTALTARVADLEARLNQNSRNSSKPPSTDPPGAVRPAKGATGRKPGGQPGHKFHKRELLPVEQVDEVIELKPKTCRGCARGLKGQDVSPRRHQVTEIPPVVPHVTEYRCHGLVCEGCGTRTQAEVPTEARSAFGTRLGALVCLFVGKYRLSKRLVRDALSDVLGARLCLGSVSNLEAEMAAALEAPTAAAMAFVQRQDVAHLDETGWTEGQENGRAARAWLWVAATACVTVFQIARSRGGDIARGLLKDFTGFLVTDRWCAYNFYDSALRQLCWSHLTRDFQGFIDRGGEGGRLGALLMKERHRLFRLWHRVRDGTLEHALLEEKLKPVKKAVGRLLREAVLCAEAKTAGMAAEMLKLEPALWTFGQIQGLEPTNNFGERSIRCAVMYRKTSFGTHSERGSRFVERILSSVASLNQQRRDVLGFLAEALRAHRCQLSAPSLLPPTANQLAIAA